MGWEVTLRFLEKGSAKLHPETRVTIVSVAGNVMPSRQIIVKRAMEQLGLDPKFFDFYEPEIRPLHKK